MTDLSKPFVVSARYGQTRRFKTLGQAKAWPLKALKTHKTKFAMKFANDSIEPLMNIAGDIDALTEEELPVEVGGTVDVQTGATMFWTFVKEAA